MGKPYSPYSNRKIIHCQDTGEVVTGDRYLQSKHWKLFRVKAYNYYKGVCQRCGDPIPLAIANIHHRVYKRMGNEKLTDVVLYCNHCHACKHSGKKDQKKKNKTLSSVIAQLTPIEKTEVFDWIVEHYDLADDKKYEDENLDKNEYEISKIEAQIKVLRKRLKKLKRQQNSTKINYDKISKEI